MTKPSFVVATPFRTVCDDNARALAKCGWLRLYAVGTRRGTEGIPVERTKLLPAWGALSYAFARILSPFWAEWWRMALHPWFDHWVKSQLQPGDHIISSYGYTNAAFRWVRRHGGKTFLDAGNSHPLHFWYLITGEHRRWSSDYPPFARHHYRRSLKMMRDVDFVLAPSTYVQNSFLDRGFSRNQILENVYPLDLDVFRPSRAPRAEHQPLTLISTGSISLRKGIPYLLEAYRTVRHRVPGARLLLTEVIEESAKPILRANSDLPLEWAPPTTSTGVASRLQEADIFVLPSIEDGFARTVTEALACGLPAVVSKNTGAADLILEGRNGSVVPIRDSQAIADAVIRWASSITSNSMRVPLIDARRLGRQRFENRFLEQIGGILGVKCEC